MSQDNFERKHKLALALEGLRPSHRASRLEDFDLMTFKDDADFETWLAETKEWTAEVTGARKTNTIKPNVLDANGPVDLSKVSEATRSWLEAKKSDYKDPLGGKTGSENPYQV